MQNILIAIVFCLIITAAWFLIQHIVYGVSWHDEHEPQDWRTLWEETDGRKK